MNVTRQVSDLWPLYVADEVSADTRALVESFLAADPSFATALRQAAGIGLASTTAPALAPESGAQGTSTNQTTAEGPPLAIATRDDVHPVRVRPNRR